VPFYFAGIPEWPHLDQELAALRDARMEVEDSRVKQPLEGKDALAARLHRSPDFLDALLMTFTYWESECSVSAEMAHLVSERTASSGGMIDDRPEDQP
jgi:hypothetical protein